MFGRKQNSESRVASRISAIKATAPVKCDAVETKRQARAEERSTAYKLGAISLYNGEELRCVVQNVSRTGARVVLAGAVTLPDNFLIAVPGFKPATRAKRVWQRDDIVGLQFI